MKSISRKEVKPKYRASLVALKSKRLQVSKATSELASLMLELCELEEEKRFFRGSSVCLDRVYAGIAHRADIIAERHGFINFDILLEVITLRTSSKFVFRHGFHVLHQ